METLDPVDWRQSLVFVLGLAARAGAHRRSPPSRLVHRAGDLRRGRGDGLRPRAALASKCRGRWRSTRLRRRDRRRQPLPGSALGLFATENCLAGGKSPNRCDAPLRRRVQRRELWLPRDDRRRRRRCSACRVVARAHTMEAVSDAPTLLPTASHPPARVPSRATRVGPSSSSFAARDAGRRGRNQWR